MVVGNDASLVGWGTAPKCWRTAVMERMVVPQYVRSTCAGDERGPGLKLEVGGGGGGACCGPCKIKYRRQPGYIKWTLCGGSGGFEMYTMTSSKRLTRCSHGRCEARLRCEAVNDVNGRFSNDVGANTVGCMPTAIILFCVILQHIVWCCGRSSRCCACPFPGHFCRFRAGVLRYVVFTRCSEAMCYCSGCDDPACGLLVSAVAAIAVT